MKRSLRFAALAGALGLTLVSLKPAEAGPLSCVQGQPCNVWQDCGRAPAGSENACVNHACFCR